MDYAGGDSGLSLIANLYLRTPESVTESQLWKNSAMLLEDDSLVHLELEISHTEFDLETSRCRPLGKLPLFLSFENMEGHTLEDPALEGSLLWFPLSGLKTEFQEISFGRTRDEFSIPSR